MSNKQVDWSFRFIKMVSYWDSFFCAICLFKTNIYIYVWIKITHYTSKYFPTYQTTQVTFIYPSSFYNNLQYQMLMEYSFSFSDTHYLDMSLPGFTTVRSDSNLFSNVLKDRNPNNREHTSITILALICNEICC